MMPKVGPQKIGNSLIHKRPGFALQDVRQKVCLGGLQKTKSCLPPAIEDSGRFQRRPNLSVCLFWNEDELIFGAAGWNEFVPPHWESGIRFALGSFDNSTTRGNSFSL